MLNRVLARLRRTFAGRPDAQVVAAALLPPGRRIYAVGDVHGRHDLLSRMRDLIAADLTRHEHDEALIVFLGDYVDRGPHSRAVLDALTAADFPAPILPLLGNHEAMLLEFLSRPETGETWRKFGGIETVHSYGVDTSDLRAAKNLPAVADELRRAMPPHHLEFLHGLALTHSAGEYFFCHAGVRPGVPLAQQTEEDLLWIREDFIGSEADFGAVVVHGHTPGEKPLVRENAIGIDTGAYITGRLTCLALGTHSVAFLST